MIPLTDGFMGPGDRLKGELPGVHGVRHKGRGDRQGHARTVIAAIFQRAQQGRAVREIAGGKVAPDFQFKFQDAVLIGADQGYYGECNFQIDLDTTHYLRLDRSLLRGLFGKFNPSRGDLVFSRTGELLGIMVNNTYCLTINNFTATASLPFAEDLRPRHTGGILAQLYGYVFQMPLRLQ